MSKENKCLGCGVIKQTTNKDEVGYILDINHDYCYDCFQLVNYGKNLNHYHPDNYLDIKENSLVLIIQSVMQLDLLFTLPIERIQPNAKYIYIINQVDLLPKDTNLDHLYNNIHKEAKKHRINYQDIIFMSALSNDDLFNLKDYLLNQKYKDIYLFGFQNSGKTTILKGLTNNKTALNINKAGLTQNTIEEILENKIIHDMPGTYVKGYLSDYLTFEEYRRMLPKNNIKPKIHQLKSTQKIVINDFIEISFSGIDKESFVFYLNNFNTLTKYNLKNENNYLTDKFEYVTKTFKTYKTKTQFTIADLMFFNVNNEFSITIKYPKNMHITMTESLLK